MAKNRCGYCKSTHSNPLYTTSDIFDHHFEMKRCSNCNAIFISPPPNEAMLAMAYDDNYYGKGKEKFKEGIIEKTLDYFRKQRANLVAKNTPKNGKVLDIGCGNGRFLSFVKNKGDFEIFGIEMNGGSADRAELVKGLKLKRGFLEHDDFASKSIDTITLFHVFEHLQEPVKYLDIISNIIKPNGLVVISFPNIESIQSKIFKGKWLHLDPPRHLFFFSPKDFKNIMDKYGFELLRERHFSLEYNPFGFQQSLLNLICKKREVLYESLKGNKDYVKEYSPFNLLLQNLFFKLSAPIFIASDLLESALGRGATVEFAFRKKP